MEQVLFLVTIFASFVFSGRCSDGYNYSRNDFPEGFVFSGKELLMKTEKCLAFGIPKLTLEDVKLMYEMGLDAIQFSISWPRLIPSGRGPVNPKGLQFYKSFIDELKRHGIEPHVTLYHNDLPQVLEDEYGGWIDRKIM